MELIFGVLPLTQYDAAAAPMFASFTDKADLTPYRLITPRTDLLAKNPAVGRAAKASARLDFSAYDRADPDELNRILWESIKGPNVSMPPPVHRLFPAALAGARKDRDRRSARIVCWRVLQ